MYNLFVRHFSLIGQCVGDDFSFMCCNNDVRTRLCNNDVRTCMMIHCAVRLIFSCGAAVIMLLP